MANSQGGQESDNPLLKTLPPATDYLSYLIVVEHNLTKEQLPTLHGVLQDTKLTANIGWDLVHLLLPLLPESCQCLLDVARLGNPREVVLKVTELLDQIRLEGEDEQDEDEAEQAEESIDGGVANEVATENGLDEPGGDAGKESNDESTERGAMGSAQNHEDLQLQVLRYTSMVDMLSILHPRIKTQYPSRFLTTSLQAVLPAYSQVARDPLATEVTLDMVKKLSPSQRPRLPPRKNSSHVTSTSTAPESAPDPEGIEIVVGTDEVALQARLVQSFLTFVAEGYVQGFKRYEDIPGLAWSCRYYETTHPEKRITGRPSYIAMFVEEEEELHARDTILGQCLAASRDLKINPRELLSIISHVDAPESEDQEELPSKPSDVPLSRTGALYLLCALVASSTFFDVPVSLPTMRLFPDFAGILSYCLSTSSSGSIGSEPEAIVDAVLFLGHWILSQDPKIDKSNDTSFNDILQRLSLLSANTPSASLRYQAHLLTSNLLHMHPSANFRLAFIKDTLEHCPFENLKASAVGWLKDEILAARSSPQEGPSIFATPAVLQSTATLLLVDPSTLVHGQPIEENQSASSKQAGTYAVFQQNQSFILAVLNLLYLLISSPRLRDSLQVKSSPKDFDIIGYCDRMRAASLLFQGWIASDELTELDGNGGSGEDAKNARMADLQLLDQTIKRVMEAAGAAELP